MSEIDAGERKYRHGDSITFELGSDAATAGDAVALSSTDGRVVLTDGGNGFIGVLGTQTEAGDADRAAGVASGDDVRVELRGAIRAKVAAAVGTVAAGQQLAPGANGALTNVDDGAGAPVQAGPGDIQAISDADADGYALVHVP